MSANEHHFCMCVIPKTTKTRAAMLKKYQWPIRLHDHRRSFLGGFKSLQQRVEKVAREWTGANMAKVTFQFRYPGDADIRIAFKQGNGSSRP